MSLLKPLSLPLPPSFADHFSAYIVIEYAQCIERESALCVVDDTIEGCTWSLSLTDCSRRNYYLTNYNEF